MVMRLIFVLLVSIVTILGCKDSTNNKFDLESAGRIAMQKFSSGNVTEARADISEIIATDIGSKDYFVHFLCGVIHAGEPNGKVTHNNDAYQKAISCFERSLMLNPDYEATWRTYLAVLSEAGRDREAVDVFKRIWKQYEMPQEHSINTAVYIAEDSFLRAGEGQLLLKLYSELVAVRKEDKNMLFRYRKLKAEVSEDENGIGAN